MVRASGRAETVRDRLGRCASAATITELNSPAGTAHVYLAGEFDMANADKIVEQVASALTHRPRTVTLDLSAVEFIGSSGLSAMVTARNLCIAAGTDLVVANVGRPVQRLLAVTGLDRLFSTASTD